MAKGVKTGGRQKGTANKNTAALKDAILNVLHRVGGEDYLASVAIADPKTFCTLLGKILPMQIAGDPDAPVKHRIEVHIVDPQAAGCAGA